MPRNTARNTARNTTTTGRAPLAAHPLTRQRSVAQSAALASPAVHRATRVLLGHVRWIAERAAWGTEPHEQRLAIMAGCVCTIAEATGESPSAVLLRLGTGALMRRGWRPDAGQSLRGVPPLIREAIKTVPGPVGERLRALDTTARKARYKDRLAAYQGKLKRTAESPEGIAAKAAWAEAFAALDRGDEAAAQAHTDRAAALDTAAAATCATAKRATATPS